MVTEQNITFLVPDFGRGNNKNGKSNNKICIDLKLFLLYTVTDQIITFLVPDLFTGNVQKWKKVQQKLHRLEIVFVICGHRIKYNFSGTLFV
jgi:hypothetical protein